MTQLRARVTAAALATAALLVGVGTLGAGTANAATPTLTTPAAVTHVGTTHAVTTHAVTAHAVTTAPKSPCPADRGRVVCVDLTHQKLWISDGGKLVFGPVAVRTGRKGYVTRDGLWHIYWRDLHHVSSIYHVPMPDSQFFSGGEALHAVGIPMSTPPGSHGCVNMTVHDARIAWELLRVGDVVDVFGRKPGT
ncbi:L,D-transpeptidase [Streptacidiphilus sp. MAP5-3]|uniref:L,D-transpeptidase n=1 Tax=unclassified Streptacidiphilus TaxID=2643834 RepID=UPI00351767F6